jgi:hypothetical protein
MIRVLALATVAILFNFAAAAQATSYSSATARSGETVRIAYYATITADCKMASPPQVNVVSAPKHGVLTVSPSKLKRKE